MTIAKTSGNFLDSEVMRSLEKVAVKRGMVEPVALQKTASKKSVDPSEDLSGDLFKLASALRDKGYVAEAEALEDKICLHKMAEAHLYRVTDEDGEDLVDFAHPEGDPEVAPSQGGYGKVENITTTQKKLKEIATKPPTGKYAALDPLVKMSISFGDAMDAVVEELDSDEIADATIENLVAAARQFKLPLQARHQIADLFHEEMQKAGTVQDFAQRIAEDKQRFPSYNIEEAMGILAGETFSRMVGKYQRGPQEGSYASVIQNLLKQAEEKDNPVSEMDLNQAIQWINSNITPNAMVTLVKEFFEPGVVEEVSWMGEDPDGWDDDAEAKSVGRKLYQSMSKSLKNYAEAGVDPEAFYGRLYSFMKGNYGSHLRSDDGDVSTELLVGMLERAAFGEFSRWWGQGMLKQLKGFQDKGKKEKREADPEDVSKDELRQVTAPLARAAKALADAEKNEDDDDWARAYRKGRIYAQKILGVLAKLEVPAPFSEIKNSLSEVLKPNDQKVALKGIVSLRSWARKQEEIVSELLKRASVHQEMIKAAQLVERPEKGTAPKDGEGSPKTPSGGNQWRVASAIYSELRKLGQAYKEKGGDAKIADALINTKPNGPSIKEGLKLAESIRGGVDKSIAAISQDFNSQGNLTSLRSLTQKVKAAKSLGAGTSTPGALGTFKDTPLSRKDLLSPFYFYRWAIENAFLPYQTDAMGVEVISVPAMSQLITELRQEARGQLAAVQDRKDRRLKIRFAQAVDRLARAYTNAAIASGAAAQGSSGTMKVTDLAQTASPKPGGAPGQPGEAPPGATAVGGLGKLVDVETGKLAGDGVQIEFISGGSGKIGAGFPADKVPPITRYIDLSDKTWWRDIPFDFILDYNEWNKATARSLAGLYMGETAEKAIAQAQPGQITDPNQVAMAYFLGFLRQLGGAISGVNSEYNRQVRDPAVRRKIVTRMSRDAASWLRLLNNLSGEISRDLRSLRRQRR